MKHFLMMLSALAMLPLAYSAPADAQTREVFNPTTRTYMTVNTTIARGAKPAKRFNRREVRLRTDEKVGTIIVNPRKKYLYLVLGNNRAMRYGIGVGREGFGWQGTVNIKRKAKWPSWHPPAEMRARERKAGRILPAMMKGGPENPLGARALYLYQGNKDTLYRIHGTNEPWTIGHNVSSGCIRLVNADIEDLYKRVKVGARVIVK